MNTIGVYIHIPFCIKKCPYCSFNSVEGDEIQEDLYIKSLLRELDYLIQERPELSERALETVYLGGGTPSLISADGVERLIRRIRERFRYCWDLPSNPPLPPFSKGGNIRIPPLKKGDEGGFSLSYENNHPEITLEVNPGTVTLDNLKLFKKAGINRLSIGVQSFNDKRLRTLGRIHSVSDSMRCYEDAREAGFHNIGIDLISCIPGQTISEWGSELDTAISLRPEHISAYTLTIEKGTPFYTMHNTGKLLLPSEEEQAGMFELTIDRLTSAGYNHYEISNYSLEGYQSGHNNRYWRYWDSGDYIGLGAGAHSYMSHPEWGGRRWNETLPDKYMNAVKECGSAIKGMEQLSKEDAVTESIFLGLRKIDGIDSDWFTRRFNFSLIDSRKTKISELTEEGFLTLTGNRLSLTRKGLLVADSVIIELLS